MASPAPAASKKSKLTAAVTTAKKLRTPGKQGEALPRIVVPKLRLGSAEPSLSESSKQLEAEPLASSQRQKLSVVSQTKQAGKDINKGEKQLSSTTQSSTLASQSAGDRVKQATADRPPVSQMDQAAASAEVPARKSARQPASTVVGQLSLKKSGASLLSSPDYSPEKRSRQVAEAPAAAEDNVPLACQTAISRRR